MRAVTMDKKELQEVVARNRATHRETFERALEGFRARVIVELEQRLEDARRGRRIDTQIHLPQPEDHTDDYDRVLQMLSFEVAEVVELDQHEFAQYVQDDWGWKGRFDDMTRMYSR